MDFSGQNVAVTGGAGGIGEALAKAFIDAGANVVIGDLDERRVKDTAERIGAAAGLAVDVGSEDGNLKFIAAAQKATGPLDVFVANAGLGFNNAPGWTAAGGSEDSWDMSWRVNVMAHVWAARALLPGWLARGEGRFISVASAAGLLAQVGSTSYTVTKHAALSFAESMAIEHGREGIAVHCICPQGVRTNMTAGMPKGAQGAGEADAMIEPSDVAAALFKAMEAGDTLVLPHPVVRDYATARAAHHSKWIGGMQKLKAMVMPEGKLSPRGKGDKF